MQCISLKSATSVEIVRCTTINDELYLSIRDLVMHVCKKNGNTASNTWKRLPNRSEFKNSIQMYQFAGQGQWKQPVISIEGAIRLIMILPGEEAKKCRSSVASVLSRYLEGDETLIEEIKSNKSSGPISACEVLAQQASKSNDNVSSMPTVGWIYGTYSEAFPGLIKIGRSVDIEARMHSANTFCAPSPHIIVAAIPTMNSKRDEKTTHDFFSKYRVIGEFFKITREELQKYFDDQLMPLYQRELMDSIEKIRTK